MPLFVWINIQLGLHCFTKTHFNLRTQVFGQTYLSKQCRLRSDATEQGKGIRSGSTLFATHPAFYERINML